MAEEKTKKEVSEFTVEDKLRALFTLQTVDSDVDKIKTLRGELPLEVMDLEDEIEGLQTRITKLEDDITSLENGVTAKRNEITQATELIKKYESQQMNVRNNREYESLSKEIEFQTLEIELCEKRIREYTNDITGKQESIEKSRAVFGTFRGSDAANPVVGKKGEIHSEKEFRVEVLVPKQLMKKVLSAMIKAHPYEEVAYDIYVLDNFYDQVGMGMIGELSGSEDEIDFLHKLKQIFGIGSIRHTELLNKPVKKIAFCGGSGSFLLKDAISAKADVFVSSDFKYHQFFDADEKILIADIGHYESEQFTMELFYEVLIKKFPKFAVQFGSYSSMKMER